jgi:tripartite-type tricarboxylate transporter receptor subunit TctC
VVKGDFMSVFAKFHARGKFVKSINSTFISLILKTQGAKEINDFRPISLVGGVYKIIAKVLANRMRRVMDRIECRLGESGESGVLCHFEGC